jgi:TRAP-type mannitol/chloroaromatic compound transport system permease small subunit
MIEKILIGYCRIVQSLIRGIGRSVAYLLPVLASVVAYEVFARYVLDRPTIWGYDTSLFLFGYISALGGAYAQQKGAHINVDIIHAKVSERVRRSFDLLTAVLAIGFLAVMAKVCSGMFFESLELNYRTQSEWAAPLHHFWLMITVSAVIFIAQYSVQIIYNLFYLLTGRKLLQHATGDSSNILEEPPFKIDSTKVKKEKITEEVAYGD